MTHGAAVAHDDPLPRVSALVRAIPEVDGGPANGGRPGRPASW